MKLLLVTLSAALLTGCAGLDNGEWLHSSSCPGYLPQDPCIPRGEKIMLVPNVPFEAQIRWNRGERW
jgi:hypothetical protein